MNNNEISIFICTGRLSVFKTILLASTMFSSENLSLQFQELYKPIKYSLAIICNIGFLNTAKFKIYKNFFCFQPAVISFVSSQSYLQLFSQSVKVYCHIVVHVYCSCSSVFTVIGVVFCSIFLCILI